MNNALTIALIELILKHGPSAAILLIKRFDDQSPTLDQIRSLSVQSPESYFENSK